MDGYTIETLETQGYDGPVPNSFWFNNSDTLLITLPGLGYTNDMPLMFYLNELARKRHYDVLQVNYDYRGIPRETSAQAWAARMLADVQPLIDAALAKGTYMHVVLAGKSIGTRVMTTLLANGFDKATAYIWLTPLFVAEQVKQAAMANGPSAAVFGDGDYAVAGVDFAPLSEAGVRMIVMPGGNHSMMIPGRIPESIVSLAHVINELEIWFDRTLYADGATE